MYPVAGGATFRHSKSGKDVALCGGSFILPGGVDLHMPITAVHHAKDIWDCPYTFSPHRFLEVRLLLYYIQRSFSVLREHLILNTPHYVMRRGV